MSITFFFNTLLKCTFSSPNLIIYYKISNYFRTRKKYLTNNREEFELIPSPFPFFLFSRAKFPPFPPWPLKLVNKKVAAYL